MPQSDSPTYFELRKEMYTSNLRGVAREKRLVGHITRRVFCMRSVAKIFCEDTPTF